MFVMSFRRGLLPVVANAAALLIAAPSFATAPRTFVASTGNDVNACTRTAPCRTFGAAIAQTTVGGEVIVLDSAGYGPFIVDRAISVIAHAGLYAGITLTSGDGITINAPVGAKIVLRGLTLNGPGANNGILSFSGTVAHTLFVEDCVINGFGASIYTGGVNFYEPGHLYLTHTLIRNSANEGVILPPYGAQPLSQVSIERCHIENNVDGIDATTRGKMTVRDTVISGNTGDGFNVGGVGTDDPQIFIENCMISFNGTGIYVSTTEAGRVIVSNTTITENTTGVSGVVLKSFGNNRLQGNGTDGTFNSTLLQK